jgi:hypothetical protein
VWGETNKKKRFSAEIKKNQKKICSRIAGQQEAAKGANHVQKLLSGATHLPPSNFLFSRAFSDTESCMTCVGVGLHLESNTGNGRSVASYATPSEPTGESLDVGKVHPTFFSFSYAAVRVATQGSRYCCSHRKEGTERDEIH